MIFGALPVAFLYFWAPSDDPAISQINSGGAIQPEQPPRHNKDQAVAFVDVNVVPMDREQIIIGQTVVVKDGKIVEMGAVERDVVEQKRAGYDLKIRLIAELIQS